MSDFATLREVMVDTQIRPSDVTKPRFGRHAENTERAFRAPRQTGSRLYRGKRALGNGRVVMDPRTLAKLLDALDVTQDELVLDIGSGLGYSSAILSRLAEAVVALEDDATRVVESEEALQEMGLDNVCVLEGVLQEGAAQHGPYDVILVQGAVESSPNLLSINLKTVGA